MGSAQRCMTRYDFSFFDEPTARKGSDSIKWARYGEDVIPLWIADMDFRACDEVVSALEKRAREGCFGYSEDSPRAIEAMIDYHREQYGWEIDPTWVVPQPGVVTALSLYYLYIKENCGARKGVVVNRPVYHHFMMSAELLELPQTFIDLNREVPGLPNLQDVDVRGCGGWLLCNPQNPLGHAWHSEELQQILSFAQTNDLLLASDEIHGGLVLDAPHVYRPTMCEVPASDCDRVLSFVAPSKTFNLPGLGCSFAIVPNAKVRAFFERYYGQLVPGVNLFGWMGAEAAYRYGEPWRLGMLAYLRRNRTLLEAFCQTWQLPMCPLEATYLGFVNCTSLLPYLKAGETLEELFLRHGVAIHEGSIFGAPGWIRVNIATQHALLKQAFERMSDAISALKSAH